MVLFGAFTSSLAHRVASGSAAMVAIGLTITLSGCATDEITDPPTPGKQNLVLPSDDGTQDSATDSTSNVLPPFNPTALDSNKTGTSNGRPIDDELTEEDTGVTSGSQELDDYISCGDPNCAFGLVCIDINGDLSLCEA